MSELGKGRVRPDQVCIEETNASEPLMTRREAIHLTSKLGSVVGPGQVQTIPAYGLVGVRRGGGVILSQALSGNVGTCRLDVKGDPRGSSTSKGKSTEARHRGGSARSSDDAVERPWSKGAESFGRFGRSTRLGEELVKSAKSYETRLDDKSRMRREFHVRFCEHLGGQFPGVTRPGVFARSRTRRPERSWPKANT